MPLRIQLKSIVEGTFELGWPVLTVSSQNCKCNSLEFVVVWCHPSQRAHSEQNVLGAPHSAATACTCDG